MTAKPNPRVLIVNDDGIDAPGILLLEEVVRQFTDDVWVVAPDEERSGAGHSLSLSYPIRVKQRDERHFAVKGTPTDCALLGVYELLGDKRPDLLLSGINRGPNLAEDITYSGTASAAIEGAMLGIPSIALSQIWSYQTPVHWDTARHYTAQILPQLLGLEWTQGSFVNVNFPHCPLDQVSGVRVTTQGMRPPGSFRPIPRIDERHVPYYWIKIAFPDGGAAEGNDLAAARDNAVSITPMQLDMTAHDQLANFRSLFETEPVGGMNAPATIGTTEKVADAIRSGIRTGQFVPGQHLVEAELTLRLGISRSSLREALRHLSGDGIVAIHRYRGAHINRLTRREVRDLLEVLEQLVRLAARLGAASGHANRGLMDAALDAARRHDEDGDHRSYIAVRQAFYDCLFEVAGNRELPRVTPLRRADLFRAQIRPYQTRAQQDSHTEGYRAIAQTVNAGDVDAAEAAVVALFAQTNAMVDELPDVAFDVE